MFSTPFSRLTRGIDADFRRALAVLFFFAMFSSFSSFALPVYLSSVGLSGYQIGILVSLYAVASIFVTFPTGVINDRWTIRLTMIAGFLMLSVYFLGLGLFDGFLIFLPLFLIGGLGNNLGDISLRTLAFKTKMEKREGRKFGTFSFVRILSMASGLFIGGTLTFLVGFRLGFGIIALISLLVIPFISFKTTARYEAKLGQYRKDVLNKRVIFIGLIMFLFALHWGSERTAFGLFLKKDLGLDMFSFGLFTGLALPFFGIASLYFGRRIDSGRSNLKYVFFAGLVLSGAAYILGTIPIPLLSFATRIFHEFGDGMADISIYFWVSRMFDVKRVGGGWGVMYTVMLIGQITGSLVFGPLGEITGYSVPIIITGVTSIAAGFLMLAFVRIFKISDSMVKD
jgi:MFS family permease